MFVQICSVLRGTTRIGGPRGIPALMVTLLVAAAGMPGAAEAAALRAPLTMLQQPADTVPLAPIEVQVLRTPILQNAAPMSVSAKTGDDLHRGRTGFFLEEALKGLPGVQVQNRFNPAVGERVAIRGFGARAQFGLRGIRVVVDGIPATIPDGQSSLDHLDIGSLGRVEAIRGPASSLFGNASGGVLAFTTRAPAETPFEMEVDGSAGSDGLWRGQLTASGTVNETGYLVSASGLTWDGYRTIAEDSPRRQELGTDIWSGAERLGLNARVTTPLAGGELALTGNVLDLDATSGGSTTNDFRDDPSQDVHDFYPRFQTGKELQQQQGGVRWVGPLGDALEADVSAFGVHRTLINPIPFDLIDLSRNAGGVRASLGHTVATGAGDLNLQLGAQYEVQDDDRKEFGNSSGQPEELLLSQAENVTSTSVFLQGTLELSGGVVALAGLRYDNHDFEADDLFLSDGDNSGTRKMDAVSPSIGLNVPVGSINLFGNVGKVFETPTTSELSNQPDGTGGFNQDLDPMDGESFEAGIRGNLSGTAAFELTAYRTNLNNEFVPFEDEASQGVTYFRNSGESKHTGLEATLSIAPAPGVVRGDLTYTYTDARFVDYVLDGDQLGEEGGSDGNRIPGVAPQRFQASVLVTPGAWWAEVNGTYSDNVPVNDRNTTTAPSYFLVDLRVGLEEFALGTLDVSPWVAVTNLFDEDYIASVAVNAFGSRFFEPGPDRNFQVGLRARFGG